MRRALAIFLIVTTLAAWPLTLFLTEEPPFILSLSWLAITLTAVDMLFTAQVKEDKDRT